MDTTDFSNIDFSKVDPEKVGLGTNIQDCALIANAFERGAHSIPSEAAIFATLTRSIINRKLISQAASTSLSAYLKVPELAATEVSSDGAAATMQDNSQSLNLGDQYNVTLSGDKFGKALMDQIKNCIPCQLRLLSFLELHPNFDLLQAYKDWLKNSLQMFKDLANLLNNVDGMADLCNLLKSLSFMCIPDLQRIIVALMARFLLLANNLDGMIGLLQTLLAPLFAPILAAVTSLLDMLKQLVTGPLACVLDNIKQVIAMTGGRSVYYSQANTGNTTTNNVNSGLVQLSVQLDQSILLINTKLVFYTQQMRALMGEVGGGDTGYLAAKSEMLVLVRLVSFVTAIIVALVKGHLACDPATPPADEEMETFFKNFLNPNSAFNISVDPDGSIRIDEKVPDWNLPDSGNVIQFEGEPLLPGETTTRVIAKALASPVKNVVTCRLETTPDDVEKVNQWISQLDRI